MEAIMRMSGKKVITIFILFFLGFTVNAQYCDSITPTFNVDLSASPNQTWVSPYIARDGNCCGTSNPDKCLEFVITLAADAIAVNFQITGGAVPPGALFYQIDCGPQVAVGSPICLNGPGPHHLTFCKPGNNANEFSITSYSDPIIGPDITLCNGASGQIYANYYNEPSMTWTSIFPGAPGTYNGLLDCTAGCDTVNVLAAGILPAYVDYLVCGSDIAGCNPLPICDTIRVHFSPMININVLSQNDVLCNGDMNGNALVQATGGSGPFTYSWNTIPVQMDSALNNVGAGSYTVTVTDANGCLNTLMVNINEPAPLNLGLGVVPPSCFGSANGAISTVVNGGTLPYSYLWNNMAVSSNIYNLTSGFYGVIVTDSNGCQATAGTMLNDPPQLTGTITAPLISCPGAPVLLNVDANGGSGTLNYSWNPVFSNNDTVSVAPLVNTNYDCTITDDNGCSINLTTSISIITINPQDLSVSATDQQICANDSVGLTATWSGPGGVTLTWQHCPSCPGNQTIWEQPNSTQTYVITATDQCGTMVSDSVVVIVNPLPQIQISIDDNSLCPGETATFSIVGSNGPGYSYVWDFGDGTTSSQASPQHPFYTEGIYSISLSVTDPNGCSSSDMNNSWVTVHPNAVADFSSNSTSLSTLNPNFEFTNLSYNSNSFTWDFGDGTGSTSIDAEHTYEEANFYTVTLYANNMFNCPDSISMIVEVKPDWNLYVPNTFTPDNDNFNGIFYPAGYGISEKDYVFRIFNRWGDLIFESKDIEQGWDGTDKKGLVAAQDGTYTWTVQFRDLTNKMHRKEGHVNLLK